MRATKIIATIDDDPYSPATWSGSSCFLFQALEREEALVRAVSSAPSKLTQRILQLKNFQLNFQAWRFKYQLDTAMFRVRTRRAWNQFSTQEVTAANTFLQVGAWYDMTDFDGINISYHDGNLARRLDSPYGYPSISKKWISRALQFEKELYAKTNVIFPMSDWLGRSFCKDFQVKPEKVHTVYAGINMPEILDFSPPNYDSKNILFVGRDFKRKGGEVLLKAFEQVRRKIPGATLTIIGPENMEDTANGIYNPGFIAKDSPENLQRISNYYQNAQVYVLPSLYEPFGISLAEAMAHGLPCIGTNRFAIPEIIQSGNTGLLVEPGDEGDLSAKLIELLSDPETCDSYGRAGFERYFDHFRWSQVAKKIIKFTQPFL